MAVRGVLVKLGLFFGALLVALGLAEAGLRLVGDPGPSGFFVKPPNIREIIWADPKVLPGASGWVEFITGSHGIRGEEFDEGQQIRVLALGGSTTECLFLDQKEAWPNKAQDILNKGGNVRWWVGNAGASGRTTRDHVLQSGLLFKQYPRIDAALMLVGINDMLLFLERAEKYNPDYLDSPRHRRRQARKAFAVYPESYLSFPHWLRLKRLADKAWDRLALKLASEGKGDLGQVNPYARWRAYRAEAKKLPRIPDMGPGLGEYARNLKAIIGNLRAQGIRPVFMTQPVMWKKGQKKGLEELCWMGYRGRRGGEHYYSSGALEKAMQAYNQRLLEVCKGLDVDCLDLAQALPKDVTVFYDDCHFNRQGSERVAGIAAQYLGGLGLKPKTGKASAERPLQQ